LLVTRPRDRVIMNPIEIPATELPHMNRFLLAAISLVVAAPVVAQDKAITPEQLEFFEKKVRPALVQHCFECHATTAKKVKGGLLLDSRAGLLEGGDNGPAIVPGNPDKSRLIEAIRYTNVDLKMPRGGKLPDAVIADLTAWVKMGAPWPDQKAIKKKSYDEFNLAKRKAEHWCWRPIAAADLPAVKDKNWARTDVDRFLLAKLEAKGLKPAPAADPRTLLRRLHFDIVGLPPSRADVEEFVKAWDAASAKRGKLLEAVVDRLLDSPQFGERWGRHWLDLVRYAESRGHEFDYTIPNAHHYRDYVIRALNSDVPYNQFVQEHIAGDLVKQARMHKDGFNESILGTAFWFLGEEVHSPVDIRQDQADRFDNRIDVMTKTFLGLTVACARCHDHKFDAISTKDYYALFGILESSNYRLARFDTITHNRKIAEELWELRKKNQRGIATAVALAAAPVVEKAPAYMLTAAGIEGHANGLNPALVERWKKALVLARKDDSSPLHPFALATGDPKRPIKDVLQPPAFCRHREHRSYRRLSEGLARRLVARRHGIRSRPCETRGCRLWNFADSSNHARRRPDGC
jgi:cytochrome c553